jgi:hypothetical protein
VRYGRRYLSTYSANWSSNCYLGLSSFPLSSLATRSWVYVLTNPQLWRVTVRSQGLSTLTLSLFAYRICVNLVQLSPMCWVRIYVSGSPCKRLRVSSHIALLLCVLIRACVCFYKSLWLSVPRFGGRICESVLIHISLCVFENFFVTLCLCVCECMHEPECVRVFDSKYSCVCCSVSLPTCLLLLRFNFIQVKIKEKYFVLILGQVWLRQFQFLLTYHTFNYII